MTNLEKLKQMIDEENYPYFDDAYLQMRIDEMGENVDLKVLARELCIQKAGIEELKLGDITIPSPRKYFLMLASKYRVNQTRTVVRADGN